MKTKFFILAVMVTLFSATSCSKEQFKEAVNNTLANTSVAFGFQIKGVPITVGINNNFVGYYYPASAYRNYGFGGSNTTETTVCYILQKPGNSENIPIVDVANGSIGKARCDQGQGATTNEVLLSIRRWFDLHPNQPCMVLVTFTIPFTYTNDWNGTINVVLQ